jgi:hypothetical protein
MADIETVSFDGYAMIGVSSSQGHVSSDLTRLQNNAVITRAGDSADFVNGGGGLLGKTQWGLTNA